ncbi:hypothetical protein LINPERHAP2_LOCUS38542, partial [Linum perenne]
GLVYHQRLSSFVCGTNSTEYLGVPKSILSGFQVFSAVSLVRFSWG